MRLTDDVLTVSKKAFALHPHASLRVHYGLQCSQEESSLVPSWWHCPEKLWNCIGHFGIVVLRHRDQSNLWGVGRGRDLGLRFQRTRIHSGRDSMAGSSKQLEQEAES